MRISDWSSDVCSSDLAMPIAAVSRTYLAGNRRFVHKSCMKQLIRKAVVGVAALFPLMGCDTTGNLIQDHEKMCKAHGKIVVHDPELRSEEHTSELQSLMRISYAVFCLKKTNTVKTLRQPKRTEHIHSDIQTIPSD